MNTPHWLDDESRIQQAMFGELEFKTRECFERLRVVEGGCALVRFLARRTNTLMTADDIAYYLQAYPGIANTLHCLVEMGLVRCVRVPDVVLFGLTDDPEKRELVCRLCNWQDRWLTRVARLEHAIRGRAPNLAA